MRYPKHILTDVNKPQAIHLNEYWADRYLKSCCRDAYYQNTTLNLKNRLPHSPKSLFSKKRSTTSFSRLTATRVEKSTTQKNVGAATRLWKLFDINFLKREKLYTKLKYSRSPAYDIVSGGVAALFSAFIGFLISEKFGIELVDSGDFYTFFMYMVFLSFSLRPLIKILSKNNMIWGFVSPKHFLNYIHTVIILTFRSIRLVLPVIKQPGTLLLISILFLLIVNFIN